MPYLLASISQMESKDKTQLSVQQKPDKPATRRLISNSRLFDALWYWGSTSTSNHTSAFSISCLVGAQVPALSDPRPGQRDDGPIINATIDRHHEKNTYLYPLRPRHGYYQGPGSSTPAVFSRPRNCCTSYTEGNSADQHDLSIPTGCTAIEWATAVRTQS